MEFRLLRADEIDCRISICNQYGVGLLLYKDARCDQNILDETVGAMNWQRKHTRDNANCIVSLWDSEKKQWIEKEDTGKESNTEAEKGLASDSFKRACFNWGIGRELYTAPDMWVKANDLKTLKEVDGYQGKKKWECRDTFKVTDIKYQDKKIVYVQILDVSNGTPMNFGKNPEQIPVPTEKPKTEKKKIEDVPNMQVSKEKAEELAGMAIKDNVPLSCILTLYAVKDLESMTEKQHKNCIDNWEKVKEKAKLWKPQED